MKPKANSLYNEDALALAEKMDSELFDIIYLDPPWGTNADDQPADQFDYEEFLYKFLQQAHRLLKPLGHLFFHAAPLAEINFQALIEPVFQRETLRQQLILPIKTFRSRFDKVGHDYNTLFLYSKEPYAPLEKITRALTQDEIEKRYPFSDAKGQYRLFRLYTPLPPNFRRHSFEWKGFKLPKRYYWIRNKFTLDTLNARGRILFNEETGSPSQKIYHKDEPLPHIGSIWDDLPVIDHKTNRKWPNTQPKELFDRIISQGSMKGGWIFDPFCGMGASLESATGLGRHWVGNDLSKKVISLSEQRLTDCEIPFTKASISEDMPTLWNTYDSLWETPEQAIMREISQGENVRIEFKEAAKWNRHSQKIDKALIDHILREICAFMNASLGGKLIIGVTDNGEILGLEEDILALNERKASEDRYNLFISDNIANRLSSEAIGHYEIDFLTIDQKKLCIIEVDSAVKPVFFGNDFYVRNQTQALKLKTEVAIKYMNKHFNSYFS